MLPEERTLFDQFVLLWVVIEPINVVSVFLAVTGEMSPKLRLTIAVKAVAVAAAVLLFFIVTGQLLLEALGVSLVAFQLAGGIILFVMALSLVFGRLTANEARPTAAETMANELAVFPIAIPTIAGPASMLAVVLLTDNSRFSIGQQASTTAVLAAVLLITLAMLAGARQLHRIIGTAGAGVISRVTGLILTAIAVNNILEAITIYFKIPR
jgi:multiple antibiotic resistance protein